MASGVIRDAFLHHKPSETWFQEVTVLKILKMLSKSWRIFSICGRIQDLGWTQLETTSKTMRVDVENSSFGYDSTTGDLVKSCLCHCYVRTLRFLKIAPWRKVLRTISHALSNGIYARSVRWREPRKDRTTVAKAMNMSRTSWSQNQLLIIQETSKSNSKHLREFLSALRWNFVNLGHSSCWWEGVRSTVLTWEHKRSRRNHQKQCLWKWARICLETCRGIRDHRGWSLAPRDFIKLDLKK